MYRKMVENNGVYGQELRETSRIEKGGKQLCLCKGIEGHVHVQNKEVENNCVYVKEQRETPMYRKCGNNCVYERKSE